MVGICCALGLSQIGCQNRAHRDVYHAKMANEIRVLEDQLYDADYQNQILREKLHRTKSQPMAAPPLSYGPPASAPSPSKPSPSKRSSSGPSPSQPTPSQPTPLEEIEDFDMGIDLGEPILENDAFEPAEVSPTPDSKQKKSDDAGILPAPGGPEPPGPRDIDVPPIEPGEILPPPAPGEDNAAPPGKIEVPESLGTLAEPTPIPERLKLHSGLSGGHRFDDDDETDGLYLVVNVVDDRGRMIDLNQFEIEAALTIVALDPCA